MFRTVWLSIPLLVALEALSGHQCGVQEMGLHMVVICTCVFQCAPLFGIGWCMEVTVDGPLPLWLCSALHRHGEGCHGFGLCVRPVCLRKSLIGEVQVFTRQATVRHFGSAWPCNLTCRKRKAYGICSRFWLAAGCLGVNIK